MKATVTMHKAEKYAFKGKVCPKELRAFFFGNFGCARKVYNLYTDYLYKKLEESGYTGGCPISGITLPEVTQFKKEFPYLKDADSLGLSNAKIDFQNAVKRYNEKYDHVSYTKKALRNEKSGKAPLTFRGLKGMPKFHSKAQGYFSYKTNCQYPDSSNSLKNPTVRLEKDMLYLPKLNGAVCLNVHRPLPAGAVIKNVTISMDSDGTMYASIGYDYTYLLDMTVQEAALNNDASIIEKLSFIGLDYSQKDFYVDSEGRKTNCPHSYRRSEEKLAKLQRELSRMVKDSNNYNRKKQQIALLHAKIKHQRLDFVRKEASYLASRYDVVCVEDIDLRAMGSALSLGKNLHDNGFGMFRNILARKLREKSSVLVKVGRFYASTKTCSCCGYKNDDIDLKTREWTCPACGTHHDRDGNAAVNIKNEGIRIFLEYFRQALAEEEAAKKKADARSAARRKKKAA